jgi:hypothetical protein
VTRHPSVAGVARYLTEPNVNLPKPLYAIAVKTSLFAQEILEAIPEDSAELTDGLRNLLRAKDSFVRAALSQLEAYNKLS